MTPTPTPNLNTEKDPLKTDKPPVTPTAPPVPGASSNPTATMNPFAFSQLLTSMNDRLSRNNDLSTKRQAVIQHLFSSDGLSPEQLAKLDPDTQKVLNSGSKAEKEMYLRMINDDISGRSNTLDSAVKFLGEQYSNSVDQAEKQKADAIVAITKVGSSPEALSALKAMYPQYESVFDQLSQISGSGAGNIGGYDISSYATDPNHETAVTSIYNNVQQYVNDPDSLQAYISQVAPSSPVTAQMIIDSANEYGVDPALVASIIQQDSSFGTAGKAVGTLNPGNVGNDDAGNTRKFGSWEEGVGAVAQWLSRHKVVDPTESGNLLGVTGLSVNADKILRGRDKEIPIAQRTAAANEAKAWGIKNGIDTSTFSAQYKGLTDAVEKNTNIYSNTRRAEAELSGTVDLLAEAAKDGDLKSVRTKNLVKLLAGKEVNDPVVQRYATHLNQLVNEMAQYNAAVQGKTSADLADLEDAKEVISKGISKKGLAGFATAIKDSTGKMDEVLKGQVEATQKQIWELYGAGDKYKSSMEKEAAKSGKGTMSDKSFVQKSVEKSGKPYEELIRTKVPSGEVLVVNNDTGEIGHIPSREFDKKKYTYL